MRKQAHSYCCAAGRDRLSDICHSKPVAYFVMFILGPALVGVMLGQGVLQENLE
jgi:hypothetical protein